MDITRIPFNTFLKITTTGPDGLVLQLGFHDNMKNHVGTFHASAQFALAEACSGSSLQQHFPDLVQAVIPVLRKSEVKFTRPAQTDIHAIARIDPEEKEKFEQQLARKNRATIAVSVEILDQDETVTMSGVFEWFVQKIT